MEESLNDIDKQDMLPVLDVRVLDATKKSKFRVRRLINFPLAETMDEMKSTSINNACYMLCRSETLPLQHAAEKSKLRSEVIKQVKDLFDLKEMGAITEEEYEEKKKNLLEYSYIF